MRAAARTAVTIAAALPSLLAGCGAGHGSPGALSPPAPGALAGGRVPAVPRAVPIGTGARLRPGPGAVAQPGLPCHAHRVLPRDAAHLELFAAGRVLVVPAGIGVAAPRRSGALVTGGRCTIAVRTTEPTGVIELAPGTRARLGDLFAVWGRPLSPRRLLSFRGPVRAWVGGRRWTGDVRAIPLRPHAQIVLVTGPAVPVHATYAFPPAGVTHLRP